MTKLMRLRLKGRRCEVIHRVGAFRDCGDGFRVLAEDGVDLGFFGPDVYSSIVFEIRFGKAKSSVLSRERKLKLYDSSSRSRNG